MSCLFVECLVGFQDLPHSFLELTTLWFVYFVIMIKMAIAVLLGVYGVGFIFFTVSTTDIILNTLASLFVLTIDDIIYTVIMPKLGKAALQQDKHKITFEAERISGGYHAGYAWMVIAIMVFSTIIFTEAWC